MNSFIIVLNNANAFHKNAQASSKILSQIEIYPNNISAVA